MTIILVILAYMAVLMLLSRLTARRSTNDAFFRGERRSPWYLVAWGMIGASISGVTFVSVPGMVLRQDMTYLQMCLGFIPGYLLVALVLLPIYYKLNLTSIYTFLGQRLGREAYKTGAAFFLLSKGVQEVRSLGIQTLLMLLIPFKIICLNSLIPALQHSKPFPSSSSFLP